MVLQRFKSFLECGARANKIRVYEMCDSPTARAAVGYLLVSGGLHIVAYAKALEKLTGSDVGQLLPIPDVSNKKFPEAKALEEKVGIALCSNGVRKITPASMKSGMEPIRKTEANWR